ncbi:MAG: response regulator [Lachnospiraceae bacterium]|nr:response regulator [Lachnospiraceae bacterium]
MRTWRDYIERILYAIVLIIYLASLFYMTWFIIKDKAVLIQRQDVYDMEDWTYVDQMSGPVSITAPVKVEKGGREEFIFKTDLPDDLPEGSVIAFLNKSDLKVEIGDRVVKEWKRSDAPLVGGPAKNSYFVIPLEQEDAGQEIKITIDKVNFSGKFFGAYAGNEYEVVRYLEIKSGAFQFVMSLSLLICSLAILIAGIALKLIYKYDINLILMAMGIFVTSSWMVVDSFVLQFLFRTQFIDGLMSYMTTLCIVFPFIAYLDNIQKCRYRKWYFAIVVFEFISLIGFTSLHMTHILNFTIALPYLDAAVAVAAIAALVITIVDIRRGNSESYKFVAYGFLVFIVSCVIEIILINTTVERIEGGAVIAGLYILFAFAIIQQLLEIKEIQLERDRAAEEGEAKTKFLASMSHEIRTPINSILGMNEMILRESKDPDVLGYARIINDSGTMLLSLINDVLDISKIGNDMEEIVCDNYDPEKLFDNAVRILETQAKNKGIAFKVGKPRNLPKMLYGDEKRITQIVVNLLTYAVKYTREGTVTFTGECFEQEKKYVLCFYVSDTGIGIKQEDIDGIFDAFHRLDLRKNQSIQGTGLGLSIVKSLVEKMGGQIHVESVYGKGSTFSVRIPQDPMDERAYEKYNSGNSVEDDDLEEIDENYIAPEACVLEVDDNVSNQVVVRQFLKGTGVKLDVASDGREAIRLCKLNRYDVILMDHMMPELDGIETMKRIRTVEGSLNTDTPEIILTANALMGSRAAYEEEGFDNYLSKPVESVRLLKMVRKYLPPEKVMYKPVRRVSMDEGDSGTAKKREEGEGPVDMGALLARFDNNEETVDMILAEVVREGERKIPLIRQLASDEDIRRYAVEAHGVKGVMASTCIQKLSATAKEHEFAAKADDLAFVKDNVESFLNEYGEVLEYIKEYLAGKGKTI